MEDAIGARCGRCRRWFQAMDAASRHLAAIGCFLMKGNLLSIAVILLALVIVGGASVPDAASEEFIKATAPADSASCQKELTGGPKHGQFCPAASGYLTGSKSLGIVPAQYGQIYWQYWGWGVCTYSVGPYGPTGIGRWCRQCIRRFGFDQCGGWQCCR